MKIYYNPRKNHTPISHYIILGNDITPGENEVNELATSHKTFKALQELGAIVICDDAKTSSTKTKGRTAKKPKAESTITDA